MLQKVGAGLILFVITILVPAFGKMYVDMRHNEVLAEIKLLRRDLHTVMTHNGMKIPKEEKWSQ